MDWLDNVLGGIGKPRFLLCGSELCSNQSFEVNTTGWSENGANVISRVADSDTFFGDYCLKVEDNDAGAHEYAYHDYAYGSALGEKHFIASIWVKADTAHRCSIRLAYNGTSIITKDIYVTTDWKFFWIEGIVPTGISDTTLRFIFYPYEVSEGVGETGVAYVDMVTIREVLNDKELPVPTWFNQTYRKVLQSRQKINSGRLKHTGRGWQYVAEFSNEYLRAALERDRWIASNSDNLFFFPHRDYSWFFEVKWDEEFPVQYFKNKYLGHTSRNKLIGVQLLKQKTSIPDLRYKHSFDSYSEWGAGVISGCLFIQEPGTVYLGIVMSDGITWVRQNNGVQVLDLGAGGKFDDDRVEGLSVIKDDSIYRMWYTGYSGANYRIGYATSPDGIVWTRQNNGDCILNLGAGGKFDNNHVNHPSVIKIDSTYHMWYAGHDGAKYRIGYATSPDGIVWTRQNNGDCVLNLGAGGKFDDSHVYYPDVIKDGSTYHMWYGGYDGGTWRIGYATSPDGIVWTRQNNGDCVLNLGAGGKFDDAHVEMPSIILDGSTYHMWYAGRTAAFHWRIGYATSADGIVWTRQNNGDCVLNLGVLFDDAHVNSPSVVRDNSINKMWYAGQDTGHAGSTWRIGYALNSSGGVGTYGTWKEEIDSGLDNARWTAIGFKGSIPNGTIIKFRGRTAATQGNLAAASWQDYIFDSGKALGVGDNRWLEIEIYMSRLSEIDTSPEMEKLNIFCLEEDLSIQ